MQDVYEVAVLLRSRLLMLHVPFARSQFPIASGLESEQGVCLTGPS